MEMNIVDPAQRSNSVTTVLLNGERAPKSVVEYCDRKCGVVVGMGIGALTGKALRIAHMGHVNAPMTLGTLGVMEIAFQALDVPHGKGGVQAAIDWLAAEVPA